MQSNSPMFEPSKVYKPFLYPWAIDLAQTHERIHWIEQEVTLEEDINDWKRNKLTYYEKDFITQILRLFTQSDVAVGSYYYDKLIPVFKNGEIRNLLGSFAAREATHQRAYALLNDSLGLPEGDYAAFLEYAEMRDKMEHMSSSNSDIGLTLAKAVFNEGVSLFASFAMLLNFQRRGLMKGMGKVVEWSVRDESCFTGDTQILTEKGWQRFDELNKEDKVAQYESDYGAISWINPIRYIEKDFQGSLINFTNNKMSIDVTCTEDHDLLVKDDKLRYGMCQKVKASLFEPAYTRKFIRAGETSLQGEGLSVEDRLRIAFAVNAAVKIPTDFEDNYYKFLVKGKSTCKEFSTLLKINNIEHTAIKAARLDNTCFNIKVSKDFNQTLDWVDPTKVSAKWCEEFFGALFFWNKDGDINEADRCYFSTKDYNVAEKIQILAIMCGFLADFVLKNWQGKHYFLTIKRGCAVPTANVSKTVIPYAGKVYCVTVPTGNIIVRQNNKVIVIGNCHVEGISNLFRAYVTENKEVVTNQFKKNIYEMSKLTVAHEDAFIDTVFKDGIMEGLSAEETKQYIRHLTDRRLIQLGLKGIFKVKKNPILWIENILNAPSHDNFFEQRVASYEVAGLKGSWDY